MNVAEIINKKANKKELTNKEIKYMMDGIDNYVNDYQLSAFLMAIKINGFTDNELIAYTDSLINSGKTFPLNDSQIDKHSTGGIGDKVSLIISPFLSIEKIKLIKFSGRGLGFTGGTLDKLESIKNLNVNYTYDQILKSEGNLILSSTPEFVYYDKKSYEIRDTSGCVDSWELIAASIMSKKIASGARNIIIDLKIGSGSFIKNLEEAKMLSHFLKLIAKKYERDLYILFTNMEELLGYSAGNSIEINEVIEFFQGKSEKNLLILIEKIISIIYSKMKNISKEDAKKLFYDNLYNRDIYGEFLKLLESQNGDVSDLKNGKNFNPNFSYEYKAKKDGFLHFLDISKLGYFLIDIKAGRKNKGDKLYFHSGVWFNFKAGDKLKKDDKIFTIYSEKELTEKQKENLHSFFEIVNTKPHVKEIILGEIAW